MNGLTDAKSSAFADKFKQPSTFNDDNFKDFIAGDNRVQENPYLASFHTIFVRYHNIIVDNLKKAKFKKYLASNLYIGNLKVFELTIVEYFGFLQI